MNVLQTQTMIGPGDPAEKGRLAILQRFQMEEVQHLGPQDLLVAQRLAGHGDIWGRWQTPKALAPSKLAPAQRDIDFASRLRSYLAKEGIVVASVDPLMDEGVLVLTRLALLMRLAPAGGGGRGKALRLKPSTITTYLYTHWPRITARAIRNKADDPAAVGLLKFLTEADLQEFHTTDFSRFARAELGRLDTLVARGVWSDAPALSDFRRTIDPSQPAPRSPQKSTSPFLPLPEDWLAEVGPRVLWVVQDMGPNLLRLLEALPQELESINWSPINKTRRFAQLIQEHLEQNPWLDRAGKPLLPPFSLTISCGRRNSEPCEWPPRTYEHVVTLSVTLQSAHLFITLLASAGRIGEVTNLARDCVVVGQDGKDYLRGFTYKLSGNLFGDARHWPAPEILCQSLGQQARLAVAMGWLPGRLDDVLPRTPRFGNALWVSIGPGGRVGEGAQVSFNGALTSLAERLNMDAKPGGSNFHTHRFRKTIGRLAGIALWHSPLVLKRLFGHKSIEMTLHYILCDPGVREEAEKALRELRIMHCAEALEEIHQALRDGLPLPGNGGRGAARLVTAVRNEEKHLDHSGRVWNDRSAYDLAYLLTAQGQGWRLIKEDIVCSKAPGEAGLCQQKRSEPNTSNCKLECDNRIVLVRKRRDTEAVITQYLDIAQQAREDGQALVLVHAMDNLREELEAFPDIKERYLADHVVQSLFKYCEEIGA